MDAFTSRTESPELQYHGHIPYKLNTKTNCKSKEPRLREEDSLRVQGEGASGTRGEK
jgi:hypothetical protein